MSTWLIRNARESTWGTIQLTAAYWLSIPGSVFTLNAMQNTSLGNINSCSFQISYRAGIGYSRRCSTIRDNCESFDSPTRQIGLHKGT